MTTDIDEYLILGNGEFCLRSAVSAALQRAYDDAIRSGPDAVLKRVRAQIRSVALGNTKIVSDAELRDKAAEVEAARTGRSRRAGG